MRCKPSDTLVAMVAAAFVKRFVLIACATGGLVASASSSQNTPPASQVYQSPPQAVAMELSRTLGIWNSTFGPVKIEQVSGVGTNALHGVWVYQHRQTGQEVTGYFTGQLAGNVLQFQWQEPGQPALTGAGYIAFNPSGQSFSGKWWTANNDRTGDWSGWRQPVTPSNIPALGGASYGGSAEPPPVNPF